MTLTTESPDSDDPFLAVEAAVLAVTQFSVFSDLAEALFKKCVRILQWKFNSSIDDVEDLFDQMRQVINHFNW